MCVWCHSGGSSADPLVFGGSGVWESMRTQTRRPFQQAFNTGYGRYPDDTLNAGVSTLLVTIET